MADGAASRVRSASSVEDLTILSHYAGGCPPPLGTKLTKVRRCFC